MSRKLRADEQGISPVIGATLLIATIITVVAVFLAVWIPSELSGRERDHLLGAEGTFRELKGTIEGLGPGDNGSVNLSMSAGTIPIIPNPKIAGTLSVIPADFEVRADSGKLFRYPSENKDYTFKFNILPGELQAYDWYIIATTSENSDQSVSSAFFFINRPDAGNPDYHYDHSVGTEETFPSMDNFLSEGQNFITVEVVSGPAGAWIEAYVVRLPAGTPYSQVNLENKSETGDLRFDWGDWSLVYDSGMIIFIQNKTMIMESPPSLLTIKEDNANNFEIYFNVFMIDNVNDSTSSTGTSNITVSLSDDQPPPQLITENNAFVRIKSKYTNLWTKYLANEVTELNGMGIRATMDNVNGILTINGDNKSIQYFRNVTKIVINLE